MRDNAANDHCDAEAGGSSKLSSAGGAGAPLVGFAGAVVREAAAAAPARSLLLNKLWKKFCNTSC